MMHTLFTERLNDKIISKTAKDLLQNCNVPYCDELSMNYTHNAIQYTNKSINHDLYYNDSLIMVETYRSHYKLIFAKDVGNGEQNLLQEREVMDPIWINDDDLFFNHAGLNQADLSKRKGVGNISLAKKKKQKQRKQKENAEKNRKLVGKPE